MSCMTTVSNHVKFARIVLLAISEEEQNMTSNVFFVKCVTLCNIYQTFALAPIAQHTLSCNQHNALPPHFCIN